MNLKMKDLGSKRAQRISDLQDEGNEKAPITTKVLRLSLY